MLSAFIDDDDDDDNDDDDDDDDDHHHHHLRKNLPKDDRRAVLVGRMSIRIEAVGALPEPFRRH